MDDDRPRHIGESIDAYIRTHKIDDLFTRMLSATLSERPDNAREYIRKLCSNENIKEENDTTKMMKEESDDRRKKSRKRKKTTTIEKKARMVLSNLKSQSSIPMKTRAHI